MIYRCMIVECYYFGAGGSLDPQYPRPGFEWWKESARRLYASGLIALNRRLWSTFATMTTLADI